MRCYVHDPHAVLLTQLDRPQLHDVVGEYVLSQFTSVELRQAQTRLVDIFRANRPVFIGNNGWNRFFCNIDSATHYVTSQLPHHLNGALPENGMSTGTPAPNRTPRSHSNLLTCGLVRCFKFPNVSSYNQFKPSRLLATRLACTDNIVA